MASGIAAFSLLIITAVASQDCETDFRAKWPIEVRDDDLHWRPNAQEDRSGPKYRLFTSVDVREVLPNLAYHCKSYCERIIKAN